MSHSSAIAGGAGVALSPTASFAKDRVAGYPKQNEWETVLTPGQYFVLRNGGTEPPRSSPLLNEKRKGTFVCAGCKAPLFDSLVKFESTGWPSFATALVGVETLTSFTSFALGSELWCANCGGHLGDVLNDGKAFRGTPAFESTVLCIDGAARVPARGRRCTRVWRRPLQAALRAAGRRRAAVVATAAKGERTAIAKVVQCGECNVGIQRAGIISHNVVGRRMA